MKRLIKYLEDQGKQRVILVICVIQNLMKGLHARDIFRQTYL